MSDKKTLPNKFIIPEHRIPVAWSQGPYDCCVAASITKVLEVINFEKTGIYTIFSKGYTYGTHSRPDKTQGGMDYDYTIPRLMMAGTVPESMCPIIDEIPDICEKLAALPNINDLDRKAEKTAIIGFRKIKGDLNFYDNVKQCLYEHQMPLVGNMVGKRHCAVIVGWDGDKLLYHDHRGTDDIFKGRFNEAYYLDGGIGMNTIDKSLPFTDVKEDRWSYKYIKKLYEEGIMHGTSVNKFEPNRSMTREEFAAALCRALYKMD